MTFVTFTSWPYDSAVDVWPVLRFNGLSADWHGHGDLRGKLVLRYWENILNWRPTYCKLGSIIPQHPLSSTLLLKILSFLSKLFCVYSSISFFFVGGGVPHSRTEPMHKELTGKPFQGYKTAHLHFIEKQQGLELRRLLKLRTKHSPVPTTEL